MDEILGQIESLIVRLNGDRGWNRDFNKMTPTSKLKDFGIYHERERSWWFSKFGQYMDVADLKKAVTEEFGLREYIDLRRQYNKWVSLDDVAAYVRKCLYRKEEQERLRQERQERKRQRQEGRTNAEREARDRSNERGEQDREERKQREHERRSKAAKKGWARRKERERQRGQEGTRQERRNRNRNERRDEGNTKRDTSTVRAYCLHILDLPPTASEEDIKAKYRELAKRAHPDHGGDSHHFRIIKDAYDRLIRSK